IFDQLYNYNKYTVMRYSFSTFLILFFLAFLSSQKVFSQDHEPITLSLDTDWKTVAHDLNKHAFSGFEKVDFDDSKWRSVDVPHNWDAYHGYLRLKHGNKHGYAWYRKSFDVKEEAGKRHY